jgi:hypothetical protein
MTKEKLIRMAREAGWEYADDDRGFEPLWHFAALVAAAAVRETSAEYRLGWNDGAMMEREECAKVVENYALGYADPVWAFKLTAAIRARGQE